MFPCHLIRSHSPAARRSPGTHIFTLNGELERDAQCSLLESVQYLVRYFVRVTNGVSNQVAFVDRGLSELLVHVARRVFVPETVVERLATCFTHCSTDGRRMT